MFQLLLDKRERRWQAFKDQAAQRMGELSAYFTGAQALTRVEKDETLSNWFAQLRLEIEDLDASEERAGVTGRKMQVLLTALEEVESFEKISADVQVRAFLEETRETLRQMVRIVNVKASILNTVRWVPCAAKPRRRAVPPLYARR